MFYVLQTDIVHLTQLKYPDVSRVNIDINKEFKQF